MKHYKLFFLSLFLLSAAFDGVAQDTYSKKILLTTRNGLTNNTIYSIYEDHHGFMWYGTNNGLNRDDGFTIKIFKHKQDSKNSLSNNTIKALYQDKSDNLWIGTMNGLNCYNPILEKFTAFFSDNSTPHTLSSNFINDIIPFDSENLCIASANGFNIFNTKTFRVKRFFRDEKNPNSLSENTVTSLSLAGNGVVWIGTTNGLNRFDTKNGYFTHFFIEKNNPNSISGNNIRSIYIDDLDIIWLSTESGLSKIEEIDPKNFKIQNFSPQNDFHNAGNDAAIVSPFSEKYLILGMQNTGMYLFNIKTNHFEKKEIISNYEKKIETIYRSKGNILWVGTQDKGIAKILLTAKLFKEILVFDENNNKPTVFSFCEDSDNSLWIGTTKGLIHYNNSTKKYQFYYLEKNDKLSNTVLSLYNLNTETLLIGTNGNGLKKFDKKTGIFTQSKIPGILNDEKIFSINSDKKNIFFTTGSSAVVIFNLQTNKSTRLEMGNVSDKIKTTSLTQINQKTAIITTLGAGLWKLSEENGKFTLKKIIIDTKNKHEISATTGFKDTKGNFYFGTVGSGLCKLTNFDSKPKIDTINKISQNDIYTILEDAKGSLWLGSNTGLLCYNPQADSLFSYLQNHGIQSNEFNLGAALKCRDSQFLFGGTSGFNCFYPDSIKEQKLYSHLVLTDFKILNKSVYPHKKQKGIEVIDKNILYADKIELTPKDYFFSIEFACLDFYNNHYLNYRYKLENFDNDWIYTDSQNRTAVYTNLPAGKYLFRVQVTDTRGNWRTDESSIKIIVHPTFYQKWYFILGLVFLGILLIFLIIKLKEKALKNEKILLEKKLHERTTEIENTKSELNEEKELTDSVFIFANDGIVLGDMAGNFIRVNPAFQKMLGYSEKELIGRNYETITPEKWLITDREELNDLRHGNSSVKEKEYIRKDGSIFPVRMSTAIFDNGTKIMAIVTDISKRKAMDKDLENYRQHLENLVEQRTVDYKIAKEQAENADRLKSAFLANMSHEIRTPMNAILGFAQLLEFENITHGERLEYIKLINLAGNSLLHLINDIIDLAKIEANQLNIISEEFSLNKAMFEVFNSFDKTKHTLDKSSIELILDIPEFENPTLRADYYRFKQILNNLINNALKFTEKGYIRIGYEKMVENRIRYFKFFVEDSGIGIPESEVGQVFERFHKLDENKSRIYGGTGLGLAISKNICELSGGRIWAESEQGKGSTFFFILPDHSIAQKETTQELPAEKKRIDWKGAKILVVEDDDNNIFYLKNVLKNTGIETLWAKNGKDAYEMFLENQPKIILSDIRMPEMDGFQLCSAIREKDKTVIIIMQSAYSQSEDMKKAEMSGSNDYISKPYKKDDLLELIDKYLSR